MYTLCPTDLKKNKLRFKDSKSKTLSTHDTIEDAVQTWISKWEGVYPPWTLSPHEFGKGGRAIVGKVNEDHILALIIKENTFA